MKKRFVLTGFFASVIIASCTNADPADGESRICLSFAEPLQTVATRAGSPFDTNSFILTVREIDGGTVYDGPYGERPADLKVKAGTYEVASVSAPFDAPAFESPQYGDSQVIVVSNGEDAFVSLLCKMTNAGVKVTLTDAFKAKYPAGKLVLKQDSGVLDYAYGETRSGYFKPGNISFYYSKEGIETALFNRTAACGELHELTLNASSEESSSGFTIIVDTAAFRIVETITVGEGFSGADGSSAQKAYSIAAAKEHMGDTCWVWGYIVGGDLSSTAAKFTGPFEKSSNLAIAASPTETSKSNCFAVELSKANVKAALNLVDNPANLGTKVFLKGVVSTYFGLPGLKSVSEFSF